MDGVAKVWVAGLVLFVSVLAIGIYATVHADGWNRASEANHAREFQSARSAALKDAVAVGCARKSGKPWRLPTARQLVSLDHARIRVCVVSTRGTGDGLQTVSTVSAERALAGNESRRLVAALNSSRPVTPGCAAIDSAPPRSYTVVVHRRTGPTWAVSVAPPACLGLRLAGRQPTRASGHLLDVLDGLAIVNQTG